jgi:hypothetical protein
VNVLHALREADTKKLNELKQLVTCSSAETDDEYSALHMQLPFFLPNAQQVSGMYCFELFV